MTSVGGIAAPPQIEQALRQASAATGTDFDYLLRTAQRESGLRPQAKSNTSSATGLFQFIEQTWFATLKQAGQQFGLGDYADAITRSANGRYNVADPDLRQEILALRRDPDTASLMAGVYTRRAGAALEDALGRAPRVGELYIAHFLGTDGATRFIEAAQDTPEARADTLFPRAARANRPIFYDRDGGARTMLQVYRNLIAHHGTETAQFADPGGGGGTIDVAPALGAQDGPRLLLASHFQNASAGQASLFAASRGAVVAPAAAPPPSTRPVGGPLNILPEAYQVLASMRQEPENPGAIPMRTIAEGPLDLTGRGSLGLLKRFAPLYELFRNA
jgi:hypothetical protein